MNAIAETRKNGDGAHPPVLRDEEVYVSFGPRTII